MKKILIIQTAFIGDVILATSLIEKIHQQQVGAIDFLVRKGNEGLLANHPWLNLLYIWDKKKNKYSGLITIIRQIRRQKYDYVINLQRFLSTGIITALSGADVTIGFQKNPCSFLFSFRYPHVININGTLHEIDRNDMLLSSFIKDCTVPKPKLYPSQQDFTRVMAEKPYITISPTSVWFTKQYPLNKWLEVMDIFDASLTIYLLGGTNDAEACEALKNGTKHPRVKVMAGKLSFLESAALIRDAKMNYVNDSAPLHIASAMNAPCTAIFCSTVPSFGFGPLSADSRVAELSEPLYCRPCGLHGYRTCPEKHFKCSNISAESIVEQQFRTKN